MKMYAFRPGRNGDDGMSFILNGKEIEKQAEALKVMGFTPVEVGAVEVHETISAQRLKRNRTMFAKVDAWIAEWEDDTREPSDD